MNKSSKIYVAGHEGLVGSAVMRRFTSSGYANLVTRTFAQLDLRRQSDVEFFFEQERPEYVVLAAAKVGGILANNTYKAEFIYDNLMIAINVIHAAYKYGVKRLVNLGSSCIYPKNAPQPMKEEYLLTGPLEETNEPYAIAKIAAIKLCRYYNEQHGTQFISLMPTNLYGPGDNYNLETSHVLPALIRKFYLAQLLAERNYDKIFEDMQTVPLGWGLENFIKTPENVLTVLKKIGISADEVQLWGSGQVHREFMHVDDLASAVEFSFVLDWQVALKGDALLNVGSGKDLTIQNLAAMIAYRIGYKGMIRFDNQKPSGTYKKLLSVDKVNKLGWKAQIDLIEGLNCMIEEYQNRYTVNRVSLCQI